jgi:hypothetical protein
MPTPQHPVPGTPSENELQDMVSNFRVRIVQCLILGDYAKGGVYVLETLLLYMAVELFLLILRPKSFASSKLG